MSRKLSYPAHLTIQESISYLLYTVAWYCLVPVLFGHWLFNSLRSKANFGLPRLTRLGYLPRSLVKSDLLIHCVSVGEVAVAATIVKQLLKKQPDLQITLTTTTPTGANNVNALLNDAVQHIYLPIDIPFFMVRMLNRLAPKQVWIIEVELWPNLIRACAKKNIPVSIINARMTEKSTTSYRKVSLLFAPILRTINHVCAQSDRDYQNYLSLGLDKSKCTMTGNIKFDLASNKPAITNYRQRWKLAERPVLIGGSTHDPEEQILLNAYAQLILHFPDLLLIIVPRHPQRFNSVADLIQQRGVKWRKASQIGAAVDSDTGVILVDQMGVLSELYHIATLAFVGGSIAQRGGHNALEPAACSVPVIMGQSTFNNPEICSTLIQAGNLVCIDTIDQLTQQCQEWLTHSEKRDAAGKAGRKVVTENQGAILGTLTALDCV